MTASGVRSCLSREVKAQALRLGFDLVGIARAERLDAEARRLEAWLDAGRHGGEAGAMPWMDQNFDKRIDPRELVPGAKSVVSVAHTYLAHAPEPLADADALARGVGKVSRYAWGDDYHDVLKEKLAELFDWLDTASGGAGGRAFVDSAPVMDKAWAQRAGIGWIGKNTNLLTRSHGSFVFLGELIVDVDLEPDDPFAADHCGSCTRCLDACPTDALDQPYQIDATRCISYHTIEQRGAAWPPQAQELAKEFGPWIFGCDICQDVCPWNKFARETRDARFQARPEVAETPLATWQEMDLEAFRQRLRKSPLKRTTPEGMARNAANAEANARRWREQNG
ncbi:tRNA epoxyqueuosine(34) reductase QueG [Rubricoccus marinus]|uniref:Epoxyqueuosine reductase n=1 Tax=Rubricoccus marinus TaxID=716817 RepID=A0A259U1M9_9BACT|nr:tRNA epoxyqueuosine(34) reductase QueG [Rubricoccus marinus]OZC03882.1 tRNA epoxyqueuosine(34) reductase QueG [Rubricoccus marinus]